MIIAYTMIIVGITGLIWLMVAALCKAASRADRDMHEQWMRSLEREREVVDQMLISTRFREKGDE